MMLVVLAVTCGQAWGAVAAGAARASEQGVLARRVHGHEPLRTCADRVRAVAWHPKHARTPPTLHAAHVLRLVLAGAAGPAKGRQGGVATWLSKALGAVGGSAQRRGVGRLRVAVKRAPVRVGGGHQRVLQGQAAGQAPCQAPACRQQPATWTLAQAMGRCECSTCCAPGAAGLIAVPSRHPTKPRTCHVYCDASGEVLL